MKTMQNVYVRTTSWNLWWGIYGLCPLTRWEDIFIYEDADQSNRLGYTCICTKKYMADGLENLENDQDEQDFVDRIQAFLHDDNIHYYFFYDDPADKDCYQVSYSNVPLHSSGVKPRSLEMWHPSEGIDLAVIEECVQVFCYKFLNIAVKHVHFMNIYSREEAIQSYQEELRRM